MTYILNLVTEALNIKFEEKLLENHLHSYLPFHNVHSLNLFASRYYESYRKKKHLMAYISYWEHGSHLSRSIKLTLTKYLPSCQIRNSWSDP